MNRELVTVGLLFALAGCVHPLPAQTVLIRGEQFVLSNAKTTETGQLWVTAEDLNRFCDFEIKPEGACIDDLCIPLKPQDRIGLLRQDQEQEFVNLELFLGLLKFPCVVDDDGDVWSIGARPETMRSSTTGLADDFSLPDREGNVIRLTDYRGSKVILFTWASW